MKLSLGPLGLVAMLSAAGCGDRPGAGARQEPAAIEPAAPAPARSADPSTMVRIPAGTFRMGHATETFAPYGSEWKENELPQHSVTLGEFYIDRDEVTVAEYVEFLRASPESAREHRHERQPIERQDDGWTAAPGRERHPITFVSWSDASAYCAWTGKTLPTEAEWERAAKGATDERRFPWGDDAATCAHAVLATKVACEAEPLPVGSRSPSGDSPEGCHDLAGNVAEWVADLYGPYVPGSAVDPGGPDEGDLRVMRGGGFRDPPSAARTTARWGVDPGARSEAVGFRCAFRP